MMKRILILLAVLLVASAAAFGQSADLPSWFQEPPPIPGTVTPGTVSPLGTGFPQWSGTRQSSFGVFSGDSDAAFNAFVFGQGPEARVRRRWCSRVF